MWRSRFPSVTYLETFLCWQQTTNTWKPRPPVLSTLNLVSDMSKALNDFFKADKESIEESVSGLDYAIPSPTANHQSAGTKWNHCICVFGFVFSNLYLCICICVFVVILCSSRISSNSSPASHQSAGAKWDRPQQELGVAAHILCHWPTGHPAYTLPEWPPNTEWDKLIF